MNQGALRGARPGGGTGGGTCVEEGSASGKKGLLFFRAWRERKESSEDKSFGVESREVTDEVAAVRKEMKLPAQRGERRLRTS